MSVSSRVVRALVVVAAAQVLLTEIFVATMPILVALVITVPLGLALAAVVGVRVGRSLQRDVDTEIRSARDVAESLAARIEHARHDATLREEVLSSMTEGVVLADASSTIVYANDVAKSFLGEPRTLPASVASEGANDLTVYHPERREIRAVTARIAGGRTLVVLQDVTEAKRIEAIRRDFVADASHEMKTPVAAVLATAETLEQAVHDDPESAARFAARLVAESRRLSELVKDLLDLSRIEKGARTAERLSLSSLVETEVERVREEAARKGLKLLADVAPGTDVNGSAEDLSLAVRNLLENAVRYTEEGEVRVTLAPANGEAVLTVSDTGVGIPQKDLPRIFERFYRVDKARSRDTGGTGLGLSIVRHVVESHGGVVRAESELGRGSLFTVAIKLA